MNELNLYEDEIIEIEYLDDLQETIDITVDGKNLFFANDILTHNSGASSSDIDMTDISESMGLAHTVDALFGIITQDIIEERENKFRMKALALREAGGIGSIQEFFIDQQYFRVSQGDLQQTIESY